jgi:glycine dehydrogenase subunit 1
MLAAIGVSSVDELFEQIPAGVRLGRELDVPPELTEVELVARMTELASRNAHAGAELSFLGAGIYDHYAPAVVDVLLSRGEFLTAYTPYQPEMSQGVLQAIFEYQTVICELTGMDVSNASGYDGTTVAADACFVAKHTSDRTKVILAETLNPQVRQVVKTYAPGFGLEVVELAHRGGVTDPDEVRAAAQDAAAVIFQQPNFFGCLEPAPELAAAAREAGAHPVAHVDLMTLGVLEAPGDYGCAMAIGEGQSAGCPPLFGGPHYGFFAARQEFIRRMPGRIVGETVDADDRRAYVLTLQTREQHIRREKATSNITTNQTLLALAGLVTMAWLGPDGLREVGETCAALAQYARERVPLEAAFDAPSVKEVAFRTPIPAREVVRRARERGVHPGYALGRDYEGMDDVLLVAVTEKRTPADIDRLARVLEEVVA